MKDVEKVVMLDHCSAGKKVALKVDRLVGWKADMLGFQLVEMMDERMVGLMVVCSAWMTVVQLVDDSVSSMVDY